MKVRTTLAATVIVGALGISACGGSGQAPTSYTAQQVVGALGLTHDPNVAGTSSDPTWGKWDAATGCTVDVVLRTPAEIKLYAGDPVATNSSQTVGVKYSATDGKADPAVCHRLFTERLNKLK